MSRYWAHILQEYNANGTLNEFRGATVKGPTAQGYSNGTLYSTYIVPDIEDSSLTITDTNNSYPIVSYGSKGGVRLMPVVGYTVNGSYSGKLYSEQANFILTNALTKTDPTTNPLGDIPSLQIDRCYLDSDPVAPRLYADSYKGVKIGQLGLTVGASSPMVQVNMQLTGSTVTEIAPTTANGTIPSYGKDPDCTSYPVLPYTFKMVSVYADFTGTSLFTISGGNTTYAVPSSNKLITVRSLSISFQNMLASTSHSDGILDRIQRTVTSVSYSLVVDLSDPDGSTGTADGGYGSLIWRRRYRAMRDSINGGTVALAVIINPGSGGKRIWFNLGKKTGFDSVQTITPLPDIFSAQISGSAMYDPDTCNVFDWYLDNGV